MGIKLEITPKDIKIDYSKIGDLYSKYKLHQLQLPIDAINVFSISTEGESRLEFINGEMHEITPIDIIIHEGKIECHDIDVVMHFLNDYILSGKIEVWTIESHKFFIYVFDQGKLKVEHYEQSFSHERVINENNL